MKSSSYVIWDTSAFSGKNGSFVLHMSIFLCFFFFKALWESSGWRENTILCLLSLAFFTYSTKQMGTNFVLLQQVTSSKVPKDTI